MGVLLVEKSMADSALEADEDNEGRSSIGELVVFALSGVFLVFVLILAVADAGGGKWRELQTEYRELAIGRAKTPMQRKLATEMHVGYRQYFLPKLHRIDRCETCHLGIQDPSMKDARQPFSSHPGRLLEHHAPDQFGCTICHRGQGRSTIADDAHGRVAHWPSPMLEGALLESSCGRCHLGTSPIPGAPVLSLGRKIFREQGCLGCHQLRGRGGDTGPDLTGVADRDVTGDMIVDEKDWEWHLKHFKNPKSVSPDSIMPNMKLSDKEAQAFTTLVLSFSTEQIDMDYLVQERSIPLPANAEERGKLVMERFGCAGCHGKNGEGGRSNPNSQVADLVPSLTKAREGYSTSEIEALIKEGKEAASMDKTKPKPPLAMPPYKDTMSISEMADLIRYIFSLAPEETDDWDDIELE